MFSHLINIGIFPEISYTERAQQDKHITMDKNKRVEKSYTLIRSKSTLEKRNHILLNKDPRITLAK